MSAHLHIIVILSVQSGVYVTLWQFCEYDDECVTSSSGGESSRRQLD